MPGVRPFDFSKLPKISSHDIKLLKELQGYLPKLGYSEDLRRSIESLISDELDALFTLRLERMMTVTMAQKAQSFPREGIYILVGLEPLEQKALLEIDPVLVHRAIDKLLGGEGELLTTLRPLTEIEEGVLSYLMLRLLASLDEHGNEKIHFRFEGIATSVDDFLKTCPTDDTGVMVTFRVSLDQEAGYARLILPFAMAQKAFLEPARKNPTGLEEDRERIGSFGFLETSLWAELGRTTLKASEVKQLEPGDVVVLENSQAHSEAGQLTGSLFLRVGTGETKSFCGKILNADRGLRVRLENREAAL